MTCLAQRSKAVSWAVMVALVGLMCGAVQAASVKATVNGAPSFGGFIQFTLQKPDQPSTNFEVEVGPPATTSMVAEGIEFEIDNTFGFEADQMDNMVTVDGVVGMLGTSPPELQMTWEVMTMGGSLPPQPNFPLANAPVGDCGVLGITCSILSLFLAGPDGTSVPVQTDGALVIALRINANLPTIEINQTVPFSAGMTTDDLNQQVDGILSGLSLPSSLSYQGLNNGFPTFASESPFDFSVHIGIGGEGNPGFHTGFVALGPIPEPASSTLLLGALGWLALRRWQRE